MRPLDKMPLDIDKLYDRSHEECCDCKKERVEPQPCKGHVAGPTSCKEFETKSCATCHFWMMDKMWKKERCHLVCTPESGCYNLDMWQARLDRQAIEKDKQPNCTQLNGNVSDSPFKDYEKLYYELIMSVGSKFENETRHQTALRYIMERENQHGAFEQAKQECTNKFGCTCDKHFKIVEESGRLDNLIANTRNTVDTLKKDITSIETRLEELENKENK